MNQESRILNNESAISYWVLNIKYVFTALILGLTILIGAESVSAHAVVKPNTAGIGSYTDFSLGVPSEKDASTTRIKLLIPSGINSVTPIVKSGWNVEVLNSDKTGEPDDEGNVTAKPEAIVWSGGIIPAHQKDFFTFSTQVPSEETELDWRVEQSYSDGSVVMWDLAPGVQPKDENGNTDFSKSGPYSKTMIINDLKASDSPTTTEMSKSDSNNLPLILAAAAVIISGFSLAMIMRSR